MSEMQGVEQKQAETTKGISETTGAVKGVQSTIADGDRSIDAKLSMIGRVLSIESPTEKAARQQSSNAAREAQAYHAEMLQLQKAGGATEQQVLEAQRSMESTAEEAAEAAEKRSMFDRFGGDEAPTPPPSGGDGGGEDKETKKTGGAFGTFFKMIKGFVGILLAIAIPALALLLNSPVFEVLKKALFDFIDFFFETVVPLLKTAFEYMQKEVFPALKKAFDDLLPMLKSLWTDVLLPLYNWFVDFMSKEGGGIDILLDYVSKQWENVKKLFQSMIDLFKNLMDGNFEAAFGNLGDIGKILMDAIDEALTAILKLGLAAFGLTFDGSIGDLIGSWLTSTWESIKAVLRSLPLLGNVEALQAGSADDRASTVDAKNTIEDAEGEEKVAKRKLRSGGNALKMSDKRVERKAQKLAELEEEAKAAGGFDKLEQSKTFGLDKNDIIEAREDLKKAQESAQKLKDKEAALNKQLSDAQAKKAEAEKQLEMVNKSVVEDAAANKKTLQLKKLPEPESEKAAEVNKAANDNKGSTVVVQQNDQSQKSNTEQKTVIEQNKTLENPAAGGRAARAIEGLH
tara:strand:+ start:29 stop:1741 length:1713 start_codon:yes stop_codon:yes gene_type:complete